MYKTTHKIHQIVHEALQMSKGCVVGNYCCWGLVYSPWLIDFLPRRSHGSIRGLLL